MGIDKIFTHWVDLLVSLLVGALEAWRIRNSLVIFHDGRCFCARQKTAKEGASAPASPLSDEMIREARQRFVVLELPATEVVQQQIAIPAQAREFASGIVRNQIERISPWRADQVTYGFAVDPIRDDATTLVVQIFMTARDTIDAIREKLSATGLAIDRIVTEGDQAGQPITLWSRLGDAAEQSLAGWRKWIVTAMIGVISVSIVTTTWALFSADSIRADIDDVSARAAALQRQLQGPKSSGVDASHDPAKGAWILKQTTPAAVMVLETLSQALPDSAYVTDLSLNKGALRITGVCGDAPSLVALLENAGPMTDVHFFAPTTRTPDGASFLFHIEAKIQPHVEAKEN